MPCGVVAHGDVFSSAPGTYDWRVTRFYKAVIPRAHAQADSGVALSPFMRERAIALGASAERVVTIPNGVDAAELGLDEAPTIGQKREADG